MDGTDSAPVVADKVTQGYARAMDEVIADNCRMKDIYEPTRDDLVDNMVKLTLKVDAKKDADGDTTWDVGVLSCFLRVRVYKDYTPDQRSRMPKKRLRLGGATSDKEVAWTMGEFDEPKIGRTLELSLEYGAISFCFEYDNSDYEHEDPEIKRHVKFHRYGWHLIGIIPRYSKPYEHEPRYLMVRYSTTGIEFACLCDKLTVESWTPDASLQFGSEALTSASTLHTPPAQTAC
jgi:hypothetical protein